VIVRFEAWGAWVKLDGAIDAPWGASTALVAIDRDGARGLGLDGGEAWRDPSGASPSAPLEVHVAVTSRCAAGCRGCYLDARAGGEHVDRSDLERTLDAVAAAGVFTVAFGGGEPTTRDDLGDLADAARARGLTPVVTTSGLGVSGAKLDALRRFAQVNVSYDGAGAACEEVRGFDGAGAAARAIRELAAAGVRVGVNVVLTRASYGALDETLASARSLGAREAQLLRYKPAGRAASLDYLAHRLTFAQAASLGPTLRRLSRAHGDGFALRIDCALVPFLSADASIALDPALLRRFGVFGCEAAGALAAVRSDGKVAPCSFAPATELDGRRFGEHAADPALGAWRDAAARPEEPCASCTLRPSCRGGCKVVSAFVDGRHGPDPECPRVRAHRAALLPREERA